MTNLLFSSWNSSDCMCSCCAADVCVAPLTRISAAAICLKQIRHHCKPAYSGVVLQLNGATMALSFSKTAHLCILAFASPILQLQDANFGLDFQKQLSASGQTRRLCILACAGTVLQPSGATLAWSFRGSRCSSSLPACTCSYCSRE